MGKINLKLLILEIAFILFAIVDLILIKNIGQNYIYYIKPIFWWGLGVLLYFLISKKTEATEKKEKRFYVLAFILLFNTLYYCLGLFFGFVRNALNTEFLSILRNLYCFVSILVPVELIRKSLISNSETKFESFFCVVTMLLITLNFSSIANNFENGNILGCILQQIIPAIITQVFLCYLTKHCGVVTAIAWQVVPAILSVILPIQPRLDSFYILLYTVASCLICFVFLYYTYTNEQLAKEVKQGKTKKPYGGIIAMLVVFLLVGLMTGMFGVVPTVIASNSMNTYIYKGDIVLINKLADYDVNSVVQFEHKNVKIVHRIVDTAIDENGKTYFVTKGDNNDTADSWHVYANQIDGEVCFVIPKIGYVSLFFNQLFT